MTDTETRRRGDAVMKTGKEAALADAEARELIRTALDRSMVVEAAAGTGKTSELVRRMIAVLTAGEAEVDRIVAVTFTEKAAGELKLRLRTELERARQRAPAGSAPARCLETALAHLEEARVSTIHSFCADLLRERPVEARIDPEFRTTTEAEAARLYAEAFHLWLQERLEDPPEGVRRSLRRRSGWDGDGPTGRLQRAGWELTTWRDFSAPWRRAQFDRHGAIDRVVRQLGDFAALTERGANPDRDFFFLDTAKARRLSAEIDTAETVRPRDYDGLEAALVSLATDSDFRRARPGRGSWYGKEIKRATVQAAHRDLMAELEAFARAADADLAALLQAELRETVERYERLKARSGRLDFVDLLIKARDLIRDSDAVRADFQRRFTHIFVDEFQDTDPLQAEILLLLSSDDSTVRSWRDVTPAPGKLFIVGDPKQSIYRFRRADVGVYQAVKAQLEARGALCVQLTTSFRAVPAIQRVVNTAFARALSGDPATLQAAYVPLSPFRTDVAEQPAVVALPVPAPYGRTRVTATAIEACLPDAVGAFVKWLLTESGWTVTERERPDQRVAVAPRHVCLLFRRFTNWGEDMTRAYVQALEARDLPHLLVGGKSFHAREEVETMRAALSAVEWPDDELSVFATLRGSLFAIGDAELLEYRHRFGRFHPFRIPADCPEHLASIVTALALLRSLHRGRNYRPVAETIGLLLVETRAHAAFALRPSGEQVLANVLHLAELARGYEASGGISFRGFVEQLRADADGGEAPEAPILEEGSDGVRIMTVHKAKGLEFPVVILADITAKIAAARAGRYLDPTTGLCALRFGGWAPVDLLEHETEEIARDTAEGVRIAYVAATRARDLLVVPAVGDGPFDHGWVAPLNPAMYPAPGQRDRSARAAGCPAFGADTVVDRPEAIALHVAPVRPGLHRFEQGDYGVVWWDPGALNLGAVPSFGIRQEELIGKDTDPGIVEADLGVYEDWRARRESAIANGSKPSLVVRTATERAADPVGTTTDVAVAEVARDRHRPAGPRFGALVHAVLATVALDAGRDEIEEVATLQGRMLGALPEEVGAASIVVAAALAHPLMADAREAWRRGACRRETPVTLCEPDGTVVEGVVDLAFARGDGWTVVDFKTDQELEKDLETYRRQVGLYAAAIHAATGLPATAVLMKI